MSSDPHKDLQVLRRVTAHLSEKHTLEYALQEITDAALELVSGDHASLRILDASGTRLLAAARSGTGAQRQSLSLGPGEGIAGWVVTHAEPLNVPDVRQESRFLSAPGQGFEVVAMLAQPLLSGRAPIGVLSVSSPLCAAFSAEDAQLARILANCSVPLIERDRLERLALTDPTTMAFNANYLRGRLKEEMERATHTGTPLSVLLIDLDQLDRINRTFGGELEELVLQIFAARVRAQCRRYDVFIRWGADEFVVLLPSTSPAQANATAEKIRAAIGDEPMEPRSGALLTQTVSVGAATWNGTETLQELLERAWGGVREAKIKGGNAAAWGPLADGAG